MPCLYFMPPISPMNLQFLLFNSFFINILQVTGSYFPLLFLPSSLSLSLSHLCCAVSPAQSLTLPPL